MHKTAKHRVKSKHQQQGSLLLIAVVIILVMSAVGFAIVTILQQSAQSVVSEVYGTRAYQAAQSGLQITLMELYPLDQDGAAAGACTNTERTFNTPALKNCEASIQCNSDNFAGFGITRFSLVAQGVCSVAGEVYSRELAVEAFDVSF